jgi:predicted short-subunit dehydrogenase-like oxidoreductase (DUF2520 family)
MEVTIVGAGRLGTAFARALREHGVSVTGPLRRGDAIGGDIVLLAVPDRDIVEAAAAVPAASLVGHTAGAMTLEVFGGRESFSMHPLMTAGAGKADFTGASASIAGSTARAKRVARELATSVGMIPIEIPDAERVAYHAAASIAANYLVTLETMAERIGRPAGLDRHHLLPLARAALENWARLGAVALTGPIARGDDEIVAKHRAEIAARSPVFLPLWDALAQATNRIAREEATGM